MTGLVLRDQPGSTLRLKRGCRDERATVCFKDQRCHAADESSMAGEWQVAVRKGRHRKSPPPLDQVYVVNGASDHTHKQGWALTPIPAASQSCPVRRDIDNVALSRLQRQVEHRSKDLIDSHFLQGFQRVLEYIERQELLQTEVEQQQSMQSFSWRNACQLIVYGLGSPAAGRGCQACFCARLSQCPDIPASIAFQSHVSQSMVTAGARAVHCQLAFLLLLQRQLPALKHTQAFDPVFSSLDATLLQTYKIEVQHLLSNAAAHLCMVAS